MGGWGGLTSGTRGPETAEPLRLSHFRNKGPDSEEGRSPPARLQRSPTGARQVPPRLWHRPGLAVCPSRSRVSRWAMGAPGSFGDSDRATGVTGAAEGGSATSPPPARPAGFSLSLLSPKAPAVSRAPRSQARSEAIILQMHQLGGGGGGGGCWHTDHAYLNGKLTRLCQQWGVSQQASEQPAVCTVLSTLEMPLNPEAVL